MPVIYYYFATAAVNADSSHMTASPSASWSRFSPPSNFVNGHISTMLFMVCRWPQSQGGDWARPHLCKLARHGPEMVHQRPCMMREMETWARWPVCTSLQQLHQKKCWNNLRDFSVKVARSSVLYEAKRTGKCGQKDSRVTFKTHNVSLTLTRSTKCSFKRCYLTKSFNANPTQPTYSPMYIIVY